MRFIEGGMDLPHRLLEARDQDRVVFFCGAGVSKGALLPDFIGLAKAVCSELGDLPNSESSRLLGVLLRQMENPERDHDAKLLSEMVPVDEIFSRLESGFRPEKIYRAVAESLKPKEEFRRRSENHDIMLRVSRSRENHPRIVTTNFDRLFEADGENVRTYLPNDLPDLKKEDGLQGVVYLHGRVNQQYSDAECPLVLSRAEFGRAYLANGWATRFFFDLLDRYTIVFVGYSANDPPVRYLLEGLHLNGGTPNPLYAFQAEGNPAGLLSWKSKGVKPLEYKRSSENHKALWDSLRLWAERADQPARWSTRMLEFANRGPTSLTAVERGQVAQFVSSGTGAQAFAESEASAEWLCVFDPHCRLKGSTFRDRQALGLECDPMTGYRLDSDPAPGVGLEDCQAVRDGAWDAFALNETDERSSGQLAFVRRASLRAEMGNRRAIMSFLPDPPARLMSLGLWLKRLVAQPAALWWVSQQQDLHPFYLKWLRSAAASLEGLCLPLKQHWRLLLNLLEEGNSSPYLKLRDKVDAEFYEFTSELEEARWSTSQLIRLFEILKPSIESTPGKYSRSVPPSMVDPFSPSDFVQFRVVSFLPWEELDVPSVSLGKFVQLLRRNVEVALDLRVACKQRERIQLRIQDAGSIFHSFAWHPPECLEGIVYWYANMFARLLEHDSLAAKRELLAWPNDDDDIFDQLRCWYSRLIPPAELADFVVNLSDDVFWHFECQDDLLESIAHCWESLAIDDRRSIENRILGGPRCCIRGIEERDGRSRADKALTHIRRLKAKGCHFSDEFSSAELELRALVPNWNEEGIPLSCRNDSPWPPSQPEQISLNCDELLECPYGEILSTANRLTGGSHGISRRPWSGLCEQNPMRAYLELSYHARRGSVSRGHWEIFLTSQKRQTDDLKLVVAIAARLHCLPPELRIEILPEASSWIERVRPRLSHECPDVFRNVLLSLVYAATCYPGKMLEFRRLTPDLTSHHQLAKDTPVGQLIRTALENSRIDDNDNLAKVSALLCIGLFLNGEGTFLRHAALAMCGAELSRLYELCPQWTIDNLVSVLSGSDSDDREAFLDGLPGQLSITPSLDLLQHVAQALQQHQEAISLGPDRAVWVLATWMLFLWSQTREGINSGGLTDFEFRKMLLQLGDEFRVKVLFCLRSWIQSDANHQRSGWLEFARQLLRSVWPKQRSAETLESTDSLCELLAQQEKAFEELAESAIPLLAPLSGGLGLYHLIYRAKPLDLVSRPELLLSVLHRLMPARPQRWPRETGDLLDDLLQRDPNLKTNPKFVELRGKWDSQWD